MFQQFTKTIDYYEIFLTIHDKFIIKGTIIKTPNKIC